jgi:hypothetical protein
MTRSDFFLDSGLIYGYVDSKDDFHAPFLEHLANFAYEEHNYYAVKRVTMHEIKAIRSSMRTRPGARRPHNAGRMILAQMIARAENLFELNKIKDRDYSATHITFFRELHKEIYALLEREKKNLDKKDRDADILTNAFIWDKVESNLNNPHFITIDKNDIMDNEADIKGKADECLETTSRLEFCLISKHAS